MESIDGSNAESLMQSMQGAVEHWQSFDWRGTLSFVDATLLQTKETREQSVAARKHLSETTKQFKRSVKNVEQAVSSLTAQNIGTTSKAVDSLTKECRSTIKLYQEEIDNLTRRCKTSENAYSSLGQALAELQDPAAVLQLAGQQIQTQQSQMENLLKTVEDITQELRAQEKSNSNYRKEIQALKAQSSSGTQGSSGSNAGLSKEERDELIQLRREVAEYEVEFRSLKNQDITIRKLEARIAELQTEGEEELRIQLEKQKEELAETEGRRATEALEREAAMERKVQTLELQLRAERAGREATQAHLLEADEGVSKREAAWEAQRQILVDDAERLRENLQAATRERDELRLRVAASSSMGIRGSALTPPPSGGASMADLMLERKAYDAEVTELSETATLLREELRSKDVLLTDEKRASEARISTLQQEKENLNSTLAALEAQLSAAPSQALVDSMKRELRILKRLEYNADDVDTERDPEIAGRNKDDEKDLETVLIGKLRRAESDLVTERMSKTELAKKVDTLQKALGEVEQAKSDAEKLISSLEKDLERAIATPASSVLRKKTEPVVTEENPATLEKILDPNAPSPPLSSGGKPTAKSSTSAVEKAEDDHSVATIVMAQRDRLRARCEALEAERDSFKRELQGQVQASESLKADNTKLYEKVRYLQSYNKAPSSRGGGLYGRSGSGIGDRDLDLEALEQRYEASVDPFRQFSKAERQRKVNEMSPMERTVFIVAKTVLATKEMRTGLFFYVLAMHLLVFVTTYHWSHASGCSHILNEHRTYDPPALPEHIQKQIAAKADDAHEA